jgi:uncharacterized membrane protein YbhN (UPF0104 family)
MANEVETGRAAARALPDPTDTGRVRLGTKRWASFRLFSSASDAPRARRPTDAVLLVLASLGVIAVSFPAPGPTAIDTATANLIAALPGLFGWFWEISYDLLIIWSLALLAVALFAKGRKRLFLDELLAMAVALVFAIVAGEVGGTDLAGSLHGFLRSSSPPVYVAIRIAMATAMVVTASPHMSRPVRYVGRWLLTIGALAGIALGATLPIGVVGGFLIGFGAAALTHLLVGSPAGRLTPKQMREALEELDVEATDITYAPLEPRGVALALATVPDGPPLSIKVFGRDAWDGQLIATVWTSIWHRGGARRIGIGRLQQVEHEAFVTLFAERGGVPVMPVIAAGMTSEGDAVLVAERTERTFATISSDEVDEALLAGIWRALAALHDLGIAHRQIDGDRVAIRADGSPAFTDLGAALVAGTDGEMRADRARLLMMTTLAVGSEPAVIAAAAALGNDGMADVLPYLQPAVLDRDTRQALRDRDLKLKDLRQQIADHTGKEVPPLEPIRRLTWGSVAKIAIAGFLAYALISAFANVGIDTIVQEFQSAKWAWLAAALVVAPMAQVPQALSTMGATLATVRFWPVLMLQYGVQFIALAVPSSAARVALEIRFFERVGVPGAGAVAIGMIDSFSTFLLQMLLIAVILISGMASLNLSSTGKGTTESAGSFDWAAVLIALGLVAVALVIAYLIPKTRVRLRRFREIVRRKRADAQEALSVLRHPSKVLLLFGGNLVAQVMLAIILGLCLRAFGHSASLAALILVNTFVSLFAGFMPVPGGVGVAEAGYTAGLIAIGIPEGAATSTALAFRMVTFYLPPLWGTFAMRWMKRNSYL